MVDISFGEFEEHMKKGDAKEWLKALKAKTDGDLISRQGALAKIRTRLQDWAAYGNEEYRRGLYACEDMILSLQSADTDMSEYCDRLWKIAYERGKAEAVQGWIPVKWHEITDEEREREGYPKDWVYFLDCEMPSGEQEILVQAKNGEIRWDVCYEDDGFSLDSGWDWRNDIIAWMPLPTPYKGGEDE